MKGARYLTLTAIAFALTTGAASAAPALGPRGVQDAGDQLLQRVHGCHRRCELGPAGWHYHVGPWCRRVACGVFPGGAWVWFCDRGRCGWWHPRERRWY
jgi:hypothetical protein